MKIAPTDESNLTLAITDALKAAKMHSFGYLGLPERWEEEARERFEADFAKRLYGHLDDGGLVSYLTRRVMCKFFKLGLEPPEDEEEDDFAFTQVSLDTYTEFSDPLKIAREIVSDLKELPRQYEVCLPIFKRMAQHLPDEFDVKISDRMYLVGSETARKSFVTEYPENNITRIHRSYAARDIKDLPEDAGAYILYKTSGCVTDRNKPKPLADFYDDTRAFFGACMSFGIIRNLSLFSDPPPAPIFVNDCTEEFRSLSLIELADSDLQIAAHSSSALPDDEQWKSEEGIREAFKDVAKMFSSEESQRLKTASIWLMRSHLSERGMDRVLDATIAIEVMLGDREASDRVGLSKLMANRCAYALGKSANERKDIYDFFINFYRVRSEIVHSGRVRISKSEQEVVRKGLALAERILRHEVKMN